MLFRVPSGFYFASCHAGSCKIGAIPLSCPRTLFPQKVSHAGLILLFLLFLSAFPQFYYSSERAGSALLKLPCKLAFLKPPSKNCANPIQSEINLDFFMCSLYNQNRYSMCIPWIYCTASSPEHIFQPRPATPFQ